MAVLTDYITLPHRVSLELPAGTTRDASGGSVAAYADPVADVPCLITQQSGGRRNQADQEPMPLQATVSGIDPRLITPDARLTVTLGPRAGKVYRVVSGDEHGPIDAYGVPQFFRARAEEVTRTG